ncbi:MAG TPA: hypothetical protein VIA98_01480 [Allosphingosinicella sp.]|jgi:hypothetical protein
MVDEKDPFRAAEAQAAEQKQQREETSEGEQAGRGQQQPTTADFERYDEEVGGNVKGISGASAGGPAV